MPSLRSIVPALAVAGGAAAQVCGGGDDSTATIASNGDASALANCQTYSGSIAIATGTTDNINLQGIRRITGSFTADNVTGITSISAPDLQEIGDSFTLNGLTILSTLSFPALAKVDTIMWTALPALQGLSFSQTGVQEVSSLEITNTQLSSLDGINLQVVDRLYVTNNPYLESVNMQLGNVTESLEFSANGDLNAEFPNLQWAYNMTFRNCSEVSIPSLASVNGSLGFYSNSFESLAAPNLTNVGGSLAFVSNDALTNITMPELTIVRGGLQLANNTALTEVNGFGALKTVEGALDLTGIFETVELPELADVRGAFNLQSTSNISCDTFEELRSNRVIKGKYTCVPDSANPEGLDGTSTTSDGSSSSSSAAHPMIIPGATGVLGVVAAIFGLL